VSPEAHKRQTPRRSEAATAKLARCNFVTVLTFLTRRRSRLVECQMLEKDVTRQMSEVRFAPCLLSRFNDVTVLTFLLHPRGLVVRAFPRHLSLITHHCAPALG
jgi:hypothetical protein